MFLHFGRRAEAWCYCPRQPKAVAPVLLHLDSSMLLRLEDWSLVLLHLDSSSRSLAARSRVFRRLNSSLRK